MVTIVQYSKGSWIEKCDDDRKTMKIFQIIIFIVLVVSVGCTPLQLATPSPDAGPLPTQEDFQVDLSSLPDVEKVAHTYLDAWRAQDYPTMYALLTEISKDAISEEEFTNHYEGVSKEVVLGDVNFLISSSLTNVSSAQVSYRIILNSQLVGEIQADTLMNLSLEGDEWHVQWDDTLVLPQLKGSNYLAMDRSGYIPARANIYDRYGQALVAQTDATAIGLVPDNINPEQEETLLRELADITGMTADDIRTMYAGFPVGAGWYLPLAEVLFLEIEFE